MRAYLTLASLVILISGGCQRALQKPQQDWPSTINMKNDLIELKVVPEAGGRVIQYKLGEYGFFWVNEELFGKQAPASGVGPKGEWLNYGGDKLWLAPQGWDNEQQWPGPPDANLDGRPYATKITMKKNKPAVVELTSPEDKRSGVQLSRKIKIFEGTTRVSIDAYMKNIDDKNRRWGIWSHTQFNAGDRDGKGYNKDYRGYCPLNSNSVFPKGYNVMFGTEDNPSYKPDYKNKIMQVHYERLLGKIGIDSKAGWVATVDGKNGYVFVQRFVYKADKEYPDRASVEFWMNGVGEFKAWGKINRATDDPKTNPYVFESEILSPYADLRPAESCMFHYNWYAAKIGTAREVSDCSGTGVTCKRLSAKIRNKKLVLDGHYGVFYKGKLQLLFLDEAGKTVEEILTEQEVSPLEPLIFSKLPRLTKDVDVPKEADTLAVFICNEKGKVLGRLAETKIVRN